MPRSPFAIAGLIIAILGWAMLMFGSSVETGFGSQRVANIHSMLIAVSMIVSGGFLLLAGAVMDVAKGFAPAVSVPANAGGVAAEAVAAARAPVDPAQLDADLKNALQKLGK